MDLWENLLEFPTAPTTPTDREPTVLYGAFLGGDPRNFMPDYEMCSEEEIAAHKADCAKWDAAEKKG